MTLLVRDEADIIKANIEYHLNHGVDFIIITDNGSNDGTMEICQDFLSRGVAEILIEPPGDFSQYLYVSRMANLATSKYQADWIINCDADEFFVSHNHINLESALKEVSKGSDIVSVNRHDFVPIVENYVVFNPSLFPYRKTTSLNLNGDKLPPKVIHRCSANISVSQGNHSVSGDDLGGITSVSDIEVYHYPIRSFAQFKSKVKNGGSGYAKNTILEKEVGFHKRHWYSLLLKDKLNEEFDKLFYDEKKRLTAIHENHLVEDSILSNLVPFNTE